MKILDNGVGYLELSFTSYYDLGFEYAKQSKCLIMKGINAYNDFLKGSTGLSLNEFSNMFLDETTYVNDIKIYAPNSFDEIRGMSDFLGLSFEEILTYLAIDETPVYINEYMNKSIIDTGNCTSIGIDNKKNIILGHNNDLPYTFKGTQIVIRAINEKNNNQFLTATLAGLIAQSGINRFGLAVSVNTMSMLNLGKSGLIGTVVMNELLTKENVEEAVEWMNNIQFAGGVNYCIADNNKIISIETSNNEIAILNKEESLNYIVHTNHPIINKDWDRNTNSYKLYNKNIMMYNDAPNKTHERYNSSFDYLSNIDDIDIRDVFNLLTIEPIKNKSSIRNFGTVISSVANINGLSLYVSNEFPDIKDYIKFEII